MTRHRDASSLGRSRAGAVSCRVSRRPRGVHCHDVDQLRGLIARRVLNGSAQR